MNAPLLPATPINPFAVPSYASLAEVAARVSSSTLPATRRRDCLSALRRISHLLGQEPSAIPADVAVLRQKLASLSPARHQLSPHTWSNLRSNLFRAIEASGLQPVLRTAKTSLAPSWADLSRSLPDRRAREGLSRFMRFCSLNGITPEQVDLAVLKAFGDAVRNSTFARKAATLEREVATLWNRLVERSAQGRGLRRLDLPSRRPAPRSGPWDALPDSFRSDMEAHLVWAAGRDPFAPDPRQRPLAPATLRMRRQSIQAAVTARVAAGTPVQQITCLGDLVTPEAFKSILRQRHEDANQQATTSNVGLAKALVAIAKEWTSPDATSLAELKQLSSKLPKLPPGLTDKNTALLRTFDDPDLLRRLIALPDQLWREAFRHPSSSRKLAKAQAALAIAILTYAPLRIGNVVALAFGTTLFLPSRPDQESTIEIPAAQMKNRQPFAIVLPARITRMLTTYRSQILKPCVKGPSVWLFDDGQGKPKLPSTISWLIERTIKRHLGIDMTAHQFRHLAAKVILDADPAAYETARQLLGHRNLTTTINNYAGLNTRRAGRLHAALIEKELAQPPAARRPARRRR